MDDGRSGGHGLPDGRRLCRYSSEGRRIRQGRQPRAADRPPWRRRARGLRKRTEPRSILTARGTGAVLGAHPLRCRIHAPMVPRAGRALPHHLRRQSGDRRRDRAQGEAHWRPGAAFHGRARTARRHRRIGRGAGQRGCAGARAAESEEGRGAGPAQERPCGRHDRRWRERCAGLEGGRPGHCHGQCGAGHQGHRAGGAGRLEILALA